MWFPAKIHLPLRGIFSAPSILYLNKSKKICPKVALSKKYRNDLSNTRIKAAKTNEITAIPLNTFNGLINPTICATIAVPIKKLKVLAVKFKPKILPRTLSGVIFCKIVSNITITTASAIPIGISHIQALSIVLQRGAVIRAKHNTLKPLANKCGILIILAK